MLGLAFIAQNFAIGLGIASFGVLVLAIEEQYQTTRTLASLGASLVLLAFGVFAPIATRLIERYSIRATMMIGVVLGSLGYAALGVAPNIWVFLSAYLFLVGPGVLFAGNFSGSLLVSNWFPGAKGRAIGLMMIPVGVMLVPLACTPLLESVGLNALYFVLALFNLLMLPLLLFVRERPVHVPAAASAVASVSGAASASASTLPAVDPQEAAIAGGSPRLRPRQIVQRPEFWLMVVGIGLLNGSGMIKISHLVALTAERGLTLREATVLLSVSGGAGAVGSLLFGWLADRIGGAGSLLLNGLVQAATWSIFFFDPHMPLLVADAIVMGMAGAGVFSAMVVAFSEEFGTSNLTKVMGVSGLFVVVPNFLSPPVAGLLRDTYGSYTPVLGAVIAACLFSVSCMAIVLLRRGSFRPAVS